MVVFTAILGMIISILASLNERRREMAILRAIGAKPIQVFALFSAEAIIITFFGVLIGFFGLYGILFLIQPYIENLTGLYVGIASPEWNEIMLMITILAASGLAGIIPAFQAYRTSLSDGLIIRG
jgi:putative ABC transport system permease protein